MQLYWRNTAADGFWDSAANWYEDVSATIPHGTIPVSGDSVGITALENSVITISDIDVDLGDGVCDLSNQTTIATAVGGGIAGGTFQHLSSPITNLGTIRGGIFPDATIGNLGTIQGGSFTAVGQTIQNGDSGSGTGEINGGTFAGINIVNGSNGTISAGLFTTDSFANNGGVIHGGTFAGNAFSNGGTITGGTFASLNFVNTGVISGGSYNPTGTIAYADVLVSGLLQLALLASYADPGFVNGGGTYSPQITVTGIPNPPAVTDVRLGVTYANGTMTGTFVGTLTGTFTVHA